MALPAYSQGAVSGTVSGCGQRCSVRVPSAVQSGCSQRYVIAVRTGFGWRLPPRGRCTPRGLSDWTWGRSSDGRRTAPSPPARPRPTSGQSGARSAGPVSGQAEQQPLATPLLHHLYQIDSYLVPSGPPPDPLWIDLIDCYLWSTPIWSPPDPLRIDLIDCYLWSTPIWSPPDPLRTSSGPPLDPLWIDLVYCYLWSTPYRARRTS
eukprot:1180644-Prorocentrum_minimum.AAC.1